MLIKSTLYQLGAGSIIKILGFLTTAILYRIYSLNEIGNYFVLISLLAIFLSLQQIGADKPLIKYNIRNKKENEHEILKTKFVLSLIFFPIFYFIASYKFDIFANLTIAFIGITLILNVISLDYILVAKKKFLSLSSIQLVSQFLLFAFFLLALIFSSKPLIIFHQIIPTFLLSFFVLIYVLTKKNINLISILNSNLISLSYFTKNKILIFCNIFLPLITTLDYFLASKILEGDDLGLMSGLYRYSLLSYGFLLIINKILFSYALNTKNSKNFKSSRNFLLSLYKVISFSGLLILIYPYLKFVMNLKDISMLIFPSLIIVFSFLLMPKFFTEINKIESSEKKISFFLVSTIFLSALSIYYFGSIYLSVFIAQANLILFLSIVFSLKWILITIISNYVTKKYNIK